MRAAEMMKPEAAALQMQEPPYRESNAAGAVNATDGRQRQLPGAIGSGVARVGASGSIVAIPLAAAAARGCELVAAR